ncbi:2-hydroxyacid dehydrogenase [Alterinioella nitratireducens]|uniref:2-hydroxyacid dehydrogenase n=1 Tax=Alterinioella nitratireducens TaxID=2735915 RepID=UPI0015573A0F|nr:D-glycerate dehydrogenase [Alterinioella nitratireducens]NPD19647.1 D-glycerate dehydrogenase [Alterinioella nitratireducens]
MKLLISRTLTDDVMRRARAEFDLLERDTSTSLGRAETIEALHKADILLPTLGDALGAEAFTGDGLRCKLLANFGVGYNHIDVEAARAHGIAVTNTPGAVTDATADIAMTLLLMTARRAGEGERLVRAGKWSGWHPVQMLGQHVTGKRLGIVGMGRIGQAIARRAHFGFGMQVAYTSRSPKDMPFPAEALPLPDLLARCDFVALAVPASPETHHLIGARELAQMQPHAVLVNIARGDVVDESALIHALQSHRIAGAGLDVYEFEPDVPPALRALQNVTLLPHLGTATEEVRSAMGHMALDNAIAFRDGHPLPNPV